MRKPLLSLLAAGYATFAMATAPTLMWHKIMDSDKTADITNSIAVTTDGNVVFNGVFGSREATDNISFDNKVIATGAATQSASDNHNLLVTKHNATDGSLIWTIHSKNGDVSSMGTSAIAPTADGGVVLLTDMRSSSLSEYLSPVIVDASGAEIDFPDWNTSCWIRNQVVIKASKDGNIEWVRRVLADQLPVPAASSGAATENTTTAALPYAIGEDSDGNIYVAGNTRAPLIFSGDRNSIFVIQPRNLESYTGDPQKAAGGLYLVKLDSEGNYLTHLQGSTDGGTTADYINSMVIDGDCVYFTGNFQGKQGCSLTIGKGTDAKSVTKSVAENGLLVACVKSQATGGRHALIPQFITCYNQKSHPTTGKSTVQLKKLIKGGESLYLLGLFQGCIAGNDKDEALITSVNQMLEGYALKISATDGSYQAGYANKLSIGGYLNGFVHDGSLYLQGYRMNAATGSYIEELDAETLTHKGSTTVANGCSPTLTAAASDAGSTRIYMSSRATNATFTLTDGTVTSPKTVQFGSLLTCHAVDTGLAGVQNVESDNSSLEVRGLTGAIEITASETVSVTVTNTKGVTVAKRTIGAGTTRIGLPTGIYIVNDVKTAVR